MKSTIRKIDGGKWKLSFHHNGKQKRITVSSKRVATQLRDDMELNVTREKLGFMDYSSRGQVGFSTVSAAWFQQHKNNVKPGTRDRYESVLRLYLDPTFKDRDIKAINRRDILHFLKSINMSPSLVGVVKSVLYMVFVYALDEEIIGANPAADINLKLKRDKYTGEPFTQEEMDRILASAPDKMRCFFLFLMRTACRLGEAIALQWSDIDFDTNVVLIQRSSNGKRVGSTKNGKSREIVLSPQLIAALEAHAHTQGRSESGIVFHHNNRYVYTQMVRRIWIKTLQDAGVPYRKLHNIRHSVASLLIEAGVNPAAVQHLLGHSTATFTMAHYVKYIRKKESVTAMLDYSAKNV